MKFTLVLTTALLIVVLFTCNSHAIQSSNDDALFVPAILKVILKNSLLENSALQHIDCSQCKDCCAYFNLNSSQQTNLVKASFVAEHVDWICPKSACPVQFRLRMSLLKEIGKHVDTLKTALSKIDEYTPENDIRVFIMNELESIIEEMQQKSVVQKMDALIATSKVQLVAKDILPAAKKEEDNSNCYCKHMGGWLWQCHPVGCDCGPNCF